MRLVTLATFATPEEAQLARNLLENEGIRSQLGDASTVGMQWSLGNAVGWVKLLVLDVDLDRAQRALDDRQSLADEDHDGEAEVDSIAPGNDGDDFGNGADPRPTPAVIDGWLCQACNVEVDDEDRACWSCGTERHGWQNPYHSSQATTIPQASRSAALSDQAETTGLEQSSSAILARAWRAAIIGSVCFPPLGNIYSLFLLFTVPDSLSQLSHAEVLKYRIAMAINLFMITAMMFIAVVWFRVR